MVSAVVRGTMGAFASLLHNAHSEGPGMQRLQ